MSTPTTDTDNSNSSMSPEEALQFVEAGMNLAGHVITDPYLNELLRKLAYCEISFDEYDAATTRYILGRA
jgi:riboflavin synthase, alpha subunit